VANLVTHYALANPGVAFTFVSNGREALRTAPVASLRERAYQLLGPALVDRLVEVGGEAGGMRVSGYVSNPQEQRTSREAQYLFVNGRYVRDRVLGRAIAEGYRSMMPSGTYPAAMLFLEVDPDRVDVNVHPAKIEVRFRDELTVRQLVATAIREALDRATRPVATFPRPEARQAAEPPLPAEPPGRLADVLYAPPPPPPRASQPPLGLDYRESLPDAPAPFGAPPASFAARPQTAPQPAAPQPAAPQPAYASPVAPSSPATADSPAAAGGAAGCTHGPLPVAAADGPAGEELTGHLRPLGQIRESFIVATDEEGLLLIDQHAAHERVLFERFRDARREGSPARQQLLIPETMDLSPAQAAAFDRLRPELEAAGFDVLSLSGRTIAITSVPAELPPTDARSLLLELLDAVEVGRGRQTLEALREEISASVACHAAIKINMPLTNEKMRWLLDALLGARNPWTCPHGRPAILRFSVRDIERQFARP
jgi:DNA mismatch repair protein MutL